MENPKQEIPSIISILTSTTSTAELNGTVSRYFTRDAKFIHPICLADSRAEILGIYQWYRIMSPATKSRVLSVIYDPDIDVLVVEVVQSFRVRICPFGPSPAKLNTRLTLKEIDGLHYIARQEDFYHTTDFIALIAPTFMFFAWFFLKAASVLSNLCAWLFKRVGVTGGGLEGGEVNLTGLLESVGWLKVPDDPGAGPVPQTRTEKQREGVQPTDDQ